MANKDLIINQPQLTSVLFNPKHEVQVWGRGTGKSNITGWKVNKIVKNMPRSSSVITGQTYTQLLTRTLPPLISFLERIGYYRDVNFFIGHKPPKKWNWLPPYEAPIKYDHYMVFGTKQGSVGFHMASQDRAGSGRGLNTDFEITDESLLINKERYDNEISATNRGNLTHFAHLPYHHGSHHTTSMPYTASAQWLLHAGNYYEEEAGIRIFDIWNRIVNMQLDLIQIEDPGEFKNQWNEIVRVKKQIKPFVSKDGTLFTLSNAFDNLQNLGFSYIKDRFNKMTRLTFLIEIMNYILDKVEDCYYNINHELQVYYDSYNYSYIDTLDYDFKKLGSPDSRFDEDCDPDNPLEMVVDWGSNISFMLICQRHRETFNFIKEFFVKPETGHVMIDDIVDEFTKYYQYHHDRTVMFVRDKYGDEKQANSDRTYNDQAIDRLISKGWRVILVEYPGKEPPHHQKYLLWGNILKENNPVFPKVRFNGNNCKNYLIAMNNTNVVEKDGKFKKDKSSEDKKSGVLPEEATHSTDAGDKIIWVNFHGCQKQKVDSIPVRFGNQK